LDGAIFAAQAGVLSGPIKTPFGYYVFDVKSISPGKVTPLSQVEASVRSQLQASQQQQALTNFVKNFRKKWTSKTDCRKGYVVMDCKQYKAPKGGSTTLEKK
jgi:foldase protein PrsA